MTDPTDNKLVTDAQISAWATEADQRLRAGQALHAQQLFSRVLAASPEHARTLSFFAMQAFANGELASARELIDRAAASPTCSALIDAQRATILLAQGERELALAALESALVRDPSFVPARLDAAKLMDELDRPRDAAEHYRIALAALPPLDAAPAALRSRIELARAALAREQLALEAAIEQHLAPLRKHTVEGENARFDECLEIFLGRKKPQLPKPGMMHFPKLAPLTFYPRSMFDWIERLEAQWQVVLDELQTVLARDDGGFIPYVQKPIETNGPGSVWNPLNHQPDWGAYFLFNQGQRVVHHCAEFPRTTALLDSLPLVHIPGRGPSAFFSRLKPGTHIPAHHGATNTRLVSHLPLIVPPNCAIRVGNDLHAWEPGKVVVFDDTIEHEAWNKSDEVRVVLIFDIWNPFLSASERDMVTAMTTALAEFYPGAQHNTDL